jgi:hypothetical protein
MAKHDDIKIEIPNKLCGGKSDTIDFSLIEKKIVLGLCGYAKSGKDTIGKTVSEKYGFKRIAFGDALKSDLNEYMKHQVLLDLSGKGIKMQYDDIDFLNPKTGKIKEILRPYMIWFGESMKRISGIHHWTNRALSMASGYDKIVITDVRRVNELELFKNGDNFRKRFGQNIDASGLIVDNSFYEGNRMPHKPFKSLLMHVSQFGLSDDDVLTHNTIRLASEQWLFDYIVLVDSRIPDEPIFRAKHIDMHIAGMVHKFPSYFL